MTSHFQDGGHGVRSLLHAASTGCPLACDVIGSLYALQFLIHSILVYVTAENKSAVNKIILC